MKTYYADYVAHAMRHYIRSGGEMLPGDSDVVLIDNYAAAEALAGLGEKERALLRDIYAQPFKESSFDTIVAGAAKRAGLSCSHAWSVVDCFGRIFAEVRGLK